MKKRTELSLTEQGIRALTDAVAKVVADHQRRGRPLAVWRDGKAVWVPADQVTTLHERPADYGQKAKG